ncbi:MAG TPA: hypothetical protein VED47_03015 [Burkholderiaceae bacterium]|nr:hypothetical protein [Burkholderiaceae bacterium]
MEPGRIFDTVLRDFVRGFSGARGTRHAKMRCVPRSIICGLILLLCQIASASDWRLYSDTTDNGIAEEQFFENEGVTRPSPDFVRVWVKTLRENEMLAYYMEHEKELTDKGAAKLRLGYSPDIARLRSTAKVYPSKDDFSAFIAGAVIMELIADVDEIHPRSILYVEIECRKKRMRILDGTFFNKNGETGLTLNGARQPWTYNTPDSPDGQLAEILCRPGP